MKWTLDTAAMPAFLRVNCEGKPAIADFEAMWDEILSIKFWTPGQPVVIDNRNLEPFTSPDAFTIAAIDYFSKESIRLGESCIAVVSDSTHNFKYSRQFQYGIRLRGSNVAIQIFNSEAQAIHWVKNYCNLRIQNRAAAR